MVIPRRGGHGRDRGGHGRDRDDDDDDRKRDRDPLPARPDVSMVNDDSDYYVVEVNSFRPKSMS